MRRSTLILIAPLLLAGCGASDAPRADDAAGATAQAAAAPAGTTISLGDLSWLLGSWRGTGEGEEFYEDFRLEDDSTITIVYYEDASRTRVQRMRGTVEVRGGTIWHSHGDARWRLDSGTPTSLSFVPVQNASNRFTWSRESADRWTAVLRYTAPDGSEVEGTYVMERIAPPSGTR